MSNTYTFKEVTYNSSTFFLIGYSYGEERLMILCPSKKTHEATLRACGPHFQDITNFETLGIPHLTLKITNGNLIDSEPITLSIESISKTFLNTKTITAEFLLHLADAIKTEYQIDGRVVLTTQDENTEVTSKEHTDWGRNYWESLN